MKRGDKNIPVIDTADDCGKGGGNLKRNWYIILSYII